MMVIDRDLKAIGVMIVMSDGVIDPSITGSAASVSRGADGQIARIRYVLPRHKAANWVGPGRGRKSTRPGANGVVELTPFEFLDRLADLVPPPRKHRHRYHGVFAANHPLRPAVTALAIGNVGKRHEAAANGLARDGHGTGGCCDAAHAHQKPRSHDTSRIAWAKLMARVGEEFPLECPTCGGDIRLIAFRLLSECETIPGLRTLGNLRLLRTSCPRTGADPEDPRGSWRTARAAAGVARSWPAHRLGRARAGALSIARSSRPHPTSCPRSTSTASERRRTPGVEAPATADWDPVCPEARKTPTKPVRGVSRNPLRTPGTLLPRLTSRSSAGRPLQKCH